MEKKTRHRLTFIIGIVVCVSIAAVIMLWASRTQKKIVTIDNVTFRVEVADTDATRKKGLQNRDSLASNAGMLFLFDTPGKPAFWMKGVNFDLDFIWIRDGRIVEFTHNAHAVAFSIPDDQVVRFIPAENIDSVLEVPSGTIDAHRFFIGDRVEVR